MTAHHTLGEQPDLNLERRQVGGRHYKHLAIQPARFSELNRLSYLEGQIVARLCRWRHPDGGGLEDLQKCLHEIELLIAYNSKPHQSDAGGTE